MICPICKTQNDKNSLSCKECGWEFVAFLSKPSDEELKSYTKKLQEFKKNYLKSTNVDKDMDSADLVQKIPQHRAALENELQKIDDTTIDTATKQKDKSFNIDNSKVWIDPDTNLMWQKKYSDKRMTFSEARDYIKVLNGNRFAGFSDWRLPTIDELLTIVSVSKTTTGFFPFKKASYFKKVFHDNNMAAEIWSATVAKEYMFIIDFNTGKKHKYVNHATIRVLAVRNIMK